MAWEPVRYVRVRAWGHDVGVIAPAGRHYAFEYEPSWVRRGIELSPLRMPLNRSARAFQDLDLPVETFHRLPAMFTDSVPDHFGNALIDAALAREGVEASSVGAMDRLSYVGSRAMGALSFEPDRGPEHTPTVIELTGVVEAARRAIRGEIANDGDTSSAMDQLILMGTSAGGARAKAVIAWNRETNEIRAGNLDNPPGFAQWLLKFDGLGTDQQLGKSQEYGRTEYAYYLMARDAGIEMAESTLIEEGGRAHFATRRFDCPGTAGDRLHLQSLCALTGADFNAHGVHDYAQIMAAMRQIAPGAEEQVFRRMVLNVLASNNDDHTKNTAFLMDATGQWSLAPAYDITYAYDDGNQWLRRHLMSVEGNFDVPTRRDMLAFADRFEVPGAVGVINMIADVVSLWPEYAARAGVSAERQAEVGARLDEVREATGLAR